MICRCGQKLTVCKSKVQGVKVARLRYCPKCNETLETEERVTNRRPGKSYYLKTWEDPRLDYHKAP